MGDNFVPGLVVGFITGVITAGVVGFVCSKILWCWGRITAIGKPQDIKSATAKAPWQVLADGCKSLFTLIIFIMALLACLVAIFFSVAASVSG